MVGPNGLEPSTSSVSGKCSNQLSYGPIPTGATFPTQTIRPRFLIARKAHSATVSTQEYQVLTTTSKAVGDCQVLDNTP
jgi:hypothetical protein